MLSMLLKSFIFLVFSIFAIARPQTKWRASTSTSGTSTIGTVDDWVSSGNYRIYSCSSQVPRVKSLLDNTYLWIQNASLSTQSSAYKAFFRGNNPSPITAVFRAITEGVGISGGEHPTLVCINEADAGIRTFWRECQDVPGTIVIQPHDTALVLLCPRFFELATAPQPEDCGVVNHASTELITDKWLLGTQYGFLIEALTHLYIREILGRPTLNGDVNEENACLQLPQDEARVNPSIYAFFTSNLRAGCTEFPTRAPIQRDRELMAVNGTDGSNGTDVVAFECLGSGANSSSCSG